MGSFFFWKEGMAVLLSASRVFFARRGVTSLASLKSNVTHSSTLYIIIIIISLRDMF